MKTGLNATCTPQRPRDHLTANETETAAALAGREAADLCAHDIEHVEESLNTVKSIRELRGSATIPR